MFVIVRKKERESERERGRRRESNKDKDWERDPEKQAKPSAGKKNMCKRKMKKEAAAIQLRTKDLHTQTHEHAQVPQVEEAQRRDPKLARVGQHDEAEIEKM